MCDYILILLPACVLGFLMRINSSIHMFLIEHTNVSEHMSSCICLCMYSIMSVGTDAVKLYMSDALSP